MSHHDPLTPEERALAVLLRSARAPEPSAAVDAAVLAAANAALAEDAARDAQGAAPTGQNARTGARRMMRRRPRWQPLAGIAASVVFAVGIAWQMQPTLLERPDPGTHSAAPLAADTAPAQPSAAPAPLPEEEAALHTRTQEDHRPAAARRAVPQQPAPAQAPPERFVGRRAAANPSPPAPAPAPAEAPARAAPAVAERVIAAPAAAAAEMQQDQEPTDAPRAFAPPMAGSAKQAPSQPAREVMRASPASTMQAPMADAPLQVAAQVQADALLSPRQWLLKIRERKQAGEMDAARASLEAYLEAYPETRVPRDLRTLLDH